MLSHFSIFFFDASTAERILAKGKTPGKLSTWWKYAICIFPLEMARPGRFELPTLCLEGRRSIQLSYGRSLPNFSYYNHLRYSLPCLFDGHFRYIRYN
jgi:hypothetical protein